MKKRKPEIVERKKIEIRHIYHYMVSHVKKGNTMFEITPEKEFDFEYGDNTNWKLLIEDMQNNGEGSFIVTFLHGQVMNGIHHQVLSDDRIITRDNEDFLYVSNSDPLQVKKLRAITMVYGLDHKIDIEVDRTDPPPEKIPQPIVTEAQIAAHLNAPKGHFKYTPDSDDQ